MANKQRLTVDLTTEIGTLSFPRVFTSTAGKNDKGETVYDTQFIIPKTQRADVRAILVAIKKVGEAKWGTNWRKVRAPLRDGDAERDELTEDGQTKGEKYPERDGCFFFNARSTKPIGVYDRGRNLITDPDEIHSGAKGKINITFYPYATSGNSGIGVGLNGVQKVADGEWLGGGSPSVETMFDLIDDDEDLGLDDEDLGLDDEDIDVDAEEAPKAKKAPAKKAAAKRKKPEPEPEPEDAEEDDDTEIDEGEDDLYADLDDDI